MTTAKYTGKKAYYITFRRNGRAFGHRFREGILRPTRVYARQWAQEHGTDEYTIAWAGGFEHYKGGQMINFK